ncbi:FkbM family methyltransferase [Patescibacteria group bacterium]|nr:FkbM family methyltransferase [Patescibacteria group bacterium]
MSPYGIVYGWKLHEKKNFPEQETYDFFKKHLTKEDVVADIGANIGLYSLFFSSVVDKVFAFEPSKKAYARLVRALRRNRRDNVVAINEGVFSRSDVLKLYYQRSGDPMGSVMYPRGAKFQEISVRSLKEIEEERGVAFTWAKIDAEGAEIEVLKGMRPVRAVLEVAQGILNEYQGGVLHFFKQIEDMGYFIYFIVDRGDVVKWDGSNIKNLKNNIYIEPR